MTLRSGFTLVELSIVLVIIGLVAGGVLVGRDLIAAATIRSTISQIEKYKTAVNTFRGKYGYLPGDIPADQAAQTGLAARESKTFFRCRFTWVRPEPASPNRTSLFGCSAPEA